MCCLIQNEDFIKLTAGKRWLMTPISLSKSKLRKRGYNQAEILTKELAKKLNLPTKNVIKKAYGANIILVDDVVKTGSTLLKTAKALKQAGAKKVIGLTLARG